MGTLYIPEEVTVQLLASEKTSWPTLRQLPAGLDTTNIAQGEFVGLLAYAGGNRTALKVTDAASAITLAKTALMRIDDNSNVSLESNAISCQKGYFEVATALYVKGEVYSAGQELTVRSGGVLGPVVAGTTHVNAVVEVPPADSAAGTLMEVTVFQPRPKA